jgi:hypothetical protein
MISKIIQTTINILFSQLTDKAGDINLEDYKSLKSKLSAKEIAKKLGISENMLIDFEEALKQYFQFREDKDKSRISCFRLSLWLETICKNLGIEFRLDESISNEELAIKQIRALELIIRDLVNENLGGKENVILKLQELFKQEIVEKWMKNADETGVLSGTTFSELSNIFLDKNIFKGVQEIFQDSEFKLKGDERETLRKILDDIRLIRNVIAHNKKISAIQIEALNVFYVAITKLIDRAKILNTNSEKYLVISNQNISFFVDKLKEDNERILGTMESFSKTLEKGFSSLESKTDVIQEQLKTNWFSKKFLILYTSLLLLVVIVAVLFFQIRSRPVNTSIKLDWVSDAAAINFLELKETKVSSKHFSKSFQIGANGNIELTDIDASNLGEPLILEFNNNNIVQIDTPRIVRSSNLTIRIKIKNLDIVKFNIRDAETGNPIKGAKILFSNFEGLSDEIGSAKFDIPTEKQSTFIDIIVIKDGYQSYKLNEVLVNSAIIIEIILNKND